MPNRHKQNRAEQDHAPNMKVLRPAEGDIHSAVQAPIHRERPENQEGLQAGQNART